MILLDFGDWEKLRGLPDQVTRRLPALALLLISLLITNSLIYIEGESEMTFQQEGLQTFSFAFSTYICAPHAHIYEHCSWLIENLSICAFFLLLMKTAQWWKP